MGSLSEQLVSDLHPTKGVSKDKFHPTLQSQWMGKYWQINNAGELLQDSEAASASVRLKLTGIPTEIQDVLAFSVGSPTSSFTSRLSIRLEQGQIKAILRAGDQEQAQEYVSTGAALKLNQWHIITVTVNYSTNSASIYVDGHKLAGTGVLKFSQKKTAATPSANMALGSEDDGSNFFFPGEIARVMVWKRELSREEAALLY